MLKVNSRSFNRREKNRQAKVKHTSRQFCFSLEPFYIWSITVLTEKLLDEFLFSPNLVTSCANVRLPGISRESTSHEERDVCSPC